MHPYLTMAQSQLITPVGANLATSIAALNAQVSAYEGSSFLAGEHMQPAVFCSVPDEALTPLVDSINAQKGLTTRHRRLIRLSAQALQGFAPLASPQFPLVLLLATAENTDENVPLNANTFFNLVERQTGIPINSESSQLFPMGRAGIFYALAQAFALLAQSPHIPILIGGVDSGWDMRYLQHLHQTGRLKTSAGEYDAFAPAEAAGFILVKPYEAGNLLPRVSYPGLSAEPGHRYSDDPFRGDGLSQAINAALMHVEHPVQSLISSMNGESLWAKELGIAQLRNQKKLQVKHLLHPADCIGDCGAAFGAIALCWAATQKQTPVLCCGSAEKASRGAAVVLI